MTQCCSCFFFGRVLVEFLSFQHLQWFFCQRCHVKLVHVLVRRVVIVHRDMADLLMRQELRKCCRCLLSGLIIVQPRIRRFIFVTSNIAGCFSHTGKGIRITVSPLKRSPPWREMTERKSMNPSKRFIPSGLGTDPRIKEIAFFFTQPLK